MRENVARVRQLTTRPFGGNIIIAAFGSPHATDEQRQARRQQLEAVIAERVPVLVLFWGDPAPFVQPAHRAGMKLLIQVGSPEEAIAASRAGVDAVILQGSEAGGHVKARRSLWETLPKTVEALGATPVIASGGIANGATIARALRAGAQGVSLGTRFVASEEAWIHSHYKERVVAGRATDTEFAEDLFYGGWPDAPHRYLKNNTSRSWNEAGRPPIGARPGDNEVVGRMGRPWATVEWHRYDSGMLLPTFQGDPEDVVMWSGLSIDMVNEIKPAAAIVRDLVRETEAALRD
jgi:NAD(P)H-dependent flavin oxidoreductase YrpB (nitropropane dioxygenase family)